MSEHDRAGHRPVARQDHVVHGHEDRAVHDGHGHEHEHGHAAGHGDGSWRGAAQATLHCLTGCAIGEVLGMVIGSATGLANVPTVALSVLLAFAVGYGLTVRGVLRAGLAPGAAVKVALAADTVSIAVMEMIDNTVVVSIPGAMAAGLTSALFWGSLALSLVLAFLVTTPVNRLMIARGLGHAVVHRYHHH